MRGNQEMRVVVRAGAHTGSSSSHAALVCSPVQKKRLRSSLSLHGCFVHLAGPCVHFPPVMTCCWAAVRNSLCNMGVTGPAAQKCGVWWALLCPQPLPATALCCVAGTAAWDPPGTELHAYKLTVSHQGSAPFCCNMFERTEKIEQEVKDFFFTLTVFGIIQHSSILFPLPSFRRTNSQVKA